MPSSWIFMQGALEPLVMNEPFQATVSNMSAALNSDQHFFLGKNTDGELMAIHIDRVLWIREED